MKPSKIFYISSSIFPSAAANSVHVINQNHALAKIGCEVTLIASRSVSKSIVIDSIYKQYGLKMNAIKLISISSKIRFALTLRIAIRAIFELIFFESQSKIISRNLYASFILTLLGKKFVYEIHDIEIGFRSWLQRFIVKSKNVKIIVISNNLLKFLSCTYNLENFNAHVLPDAAPSNIIPLPRKKKKEILLSRLPDLPVKSKVIGYFGHLYPGRGIEIIETLASRCQNYTFIIAGGNYDQIQLRRKKNLLPNLVYIGHLPHKDALLMIRAVDILLMPYQQKVSIGVPGRDTSRWMSPMKMFEYMASGTPIISSDLEVLREILVHNQNSLLVSHDNIDCWIKALNRLIVEPDLGIKISRNAYEQYNKHHTWELRAKAVATIL